MEGCAFGLTTFLSSFGVDFQVGTHLNPFSRGIVDNQGRYLFWRIGKYCLTKPIIDYTRDISVGSVSMDEKVAAVTGLANLINRQILNHVRYLFTNTSDLSL